MNAIKASGLGKQYSAAPGAAGVHAGDPPPHRTPGLDQVERRCHGTGGN